MSERLTPEQLAELRRIAEAGPADEWDMIELEHSTVLALLDEIERLQRIEQAAKRVATMHRYDHRRVAGLCDCSLCELNAALRAPGGAAGVR